MITDMGVRGVCIYQVFINQRLKKKNIGVYYVKVLLLLLFCC